MLLLGIGALVASLALLLLWRKSGNRPAAATQDMRVAPVDNPLDYRADGSIRPGDPAYDFMMDILKSGKPSIANQRPDGTWDVQELDD